MSDLKRSATRGILWTYASRFSGKALVFISTLILARLLLREDFGVAGYALVVIALLETLSGLGIGPAIIYFKDRPRARDTAFFLGLLAATLMLGLSWVGAPLVADFFRDERAIAVTRVLAFALPISALGNIHFALLEKQLLFGRKFIPDLANSVVKGASAIVFALSDFGAWSLILGQLLGTTASVVAVWIVMPWRPRWRFDPALARGLLDYGSKIVTVGVLGFLVANLGNFLVGRFLGAALLGVYVLALRIPEVLVKESALIFNKVLFPVMSQIREDTASLSRGYLALMRYLTLIATPLGLGLSAIADPFVLALLSDKWSDMIPVMQLSAVYTLLLSLGFNAGTVFKAIGRPGLIIWLSLARLALLFPLLLWAVKGQASLVAVAWVHVGVVLVHLIASLVIVGRLLDLSLAALGRALWPSLAAGVVMYASVVGVVAVLADAGPWPQLVAGIATGAVVYLTLIWLWQRDAIMAGFSTLRTSVSRRA